MDLSVIFDAIIPDNIRNLPLVKKCSEVFIEQLNRNSTISKRISKLYDVDSTTWVKRDSNGNITEVDDSEFVNNAKKILKMGLLYTYLNFIFIHISKIQKNSNIISNIKDKEYDSPLYKNIYEFLNSEYLGGLRYYQQCAGTEQAIKYMYAFAKYLETGVLTYDLVLEKMGVFNLAYGGSLNKDMFIEFNKNISHPCGWLCEYETYEYIEPEPEDLNFLDAPLDDSIIDLMENYLVIDNYHRDIYDEDYNVVETQTFYRYTNGVTDKCLYFPRIDWGVEVDNTEYPPIDYPEHDDWVIAHDLSSPKLLGVRLEQRYYSEGDSWYPVVVDNGVENRNIYDYEYGEYHITNTTRRYKRWGRYEDHVYTEIYDAEFVNENGFITCQVDFNSEAGDQGTHDDSESFIDYISAMYYTGENKSWRKIEFYLRFCNTENLDLFTEKVYEFLETKDDELFGKYDDDFYIWQTTASLSELLEQLKTTYFPDSLISKYDEKISPNNNLCFLFDYTYQNNNTIVISEVDLRDLYFYDKSTGRWYFYILEVNLNNKTINIFDCTQYFYSGEWFKVELIKTDDCVLRIGNQEHNVSWNCWEYNIDDSDHYIRVETHCMGNYGTEHAIYSQCANLKQYVPNSDSGYDFGYPWINVDCQFLYDKVILTADVHNDDPLGYSLLWSTGERTRSIEVPYEEHPHYEVTATNRAGSTTDDVDYFAYCGYDVYSLDFSLKKDLETPPIYNLEFDFKATVDDLKPLIYLQGNWNERVLSLGACYYSYNDYLYLENTDENKVPYDNKYLNNWYHYKVHVDNTNLTVSININDNEVATINLNEELIPRVVEFSCGLNGFFGCTSDYYIDNLKITYKEDEWQH